MENGKSIVESTLLQIKAVEDAISENAKGILASTMKEEISELVRESLGSKRRIREQEEEPTVDVEDEEEFDVEDEVEVDAEEDPEGTEEPESPTTEGDEVEDTVKDASTAETVEAAQSVTAAAKPAALANPLDSQRVRTPIVNKATYLEHSVRATLGNEQSKLYVAAAADTTDNAGLVPTRQLTTVINGISNADRPFIDSVSTGALPDAGMTFEIPKITVAPTVVS